MIESSKTRYSEEFFFYEKDTVIGKSLRLYGEYAQVEVEFLLSSLNSRCIVYDIGSNIGYHTTAFASVAQKVYSFEPNPHNYSLLEKNTKHLSNVELINAAVGDHTGITMISDFDPSKETENFGMMKCGENGIEVSLLSLDECLFDEPDLIKIDVEGYEYSAIQGCKNLIEKRKPLIYYEAHETKELKEIYELLVSLGYTLYWCIIPNYNTNNFNNCKEDVFGNSGLISVLAYPLHLGYLSLPPVLGPNDSFSRLIKGCPVD
jgi:FkbM family methyltransferase